VFPSNMISPSNAGRIEIDDLASLEFSGPSWEVVIQPRGNDPHDVNTLAGLMVQLAENDDRPQAMGEASANLIELAEIVKRSPRPPTGRVDRPLLRMMPNRQRGATR
jgi:hypothetical protein